MSVRANPTKNFFLEKHASAPVYGYTTGTCAVAAACAAVRMLIQQKTVPYVIVTTAKKLRVFIEIEKARVSSESASCCVQKYSGSDPDVTNGVFVYATVTKTAERTVTLDGGTGIGRVTLPGLHQNIGEAAINPVPKRMIVTTVSEELQKAGVPWGVHVEISIPEGVELAKQTFNPKLGIVGGISVLGTTGIVEPMSEQALLDTIRLELNVRKAQGCSPVLVVPGNYGSEFLQKTYALPLDYAVHCSNFVYDMVQMAKEAGFTKLLFVGHVGKLVKVAGGIKNTHSKYGDFRMEILSDIARAHVPKSEYESCKSALLSCISTESAVSVLDSFGIRTAVMSDMVQRIQKTMTEWADGALCIEVLTFTNEHGQLGATEHAREYIAESRGVSV